VSTHTNPLFLLYAVIVAQCGHLLFVLLRGEEGNRWWKFCLVVLTLSLTTMVIEFTLTWSGYLQQFPWLMGISFALPYLLGPTVAGCIYFNEQQEWKGAYTTHLLPFLFALVYSLPFLFQGEEVKSEIYETTIVTEAYFREWPYIRSIALKTLHLMAYVFLCWYIVLPKDRVGKGLRLALSVFAGLLGLHTVLLALGLPGYAISYSVLMVCFGGLALWLHYELSSFANSSSEVASVTLSSVSIKPRATPNPENFEAIPKYQKSGLDESGLEAGAIILTRLMETEAPYLDAGLRLRDLAKKCELPEHHLSQILNVHFGRKFTDYINAYRVDHASKLFTGQSPTKYRKNGPIQSDGAGK